MLMRSSVDGVWPLLKTLGNNDGNSNTPPAHIYLVQPVRLPSIKELKELPLHDRREADIVRPYVESSRSIGRHPDRFILLLLGETGHGKTKTVNRLIDNDLLEVARPCAGTTTKVLCPPHMSTLRTQNNKISRLYRGLTCQSRSTPKEIVLN